MLRGKDEVLAPDGGSALDLACRTMRGGLRVEKVQPRQEEVANERRFG